MTDPTPFTISHTFTLAPDWTITPALGGSFQFLGAGHYDVTPRWDTVTLGWTF
ncbi:MAG: hypothetical protein ACRYG8_23725 [Janthinobacterium lividum]